MLKALLELFVTGAVSVGSVLGFNTYVEPSWTLVATGDIIPARSVNFQMTKRSDFNWPIWDIAPLMASAGITLINLESPLLSRCPLTNSGMTFCADPRFAESLSHAGVDIANLANNHTLNYGWEGLKETEQTLQRHGIDTTGVTSDGSCANQAFFCSKKVIKIVKGIKLGFIGYTIVGKKADRKVLGKDIAALNSQVDILIASFHWGAEYTRIPIGAPDDPKTIGRLAVDHGADVVIGNHPHWIQGMEYYAGKPIFYALGNTIFDQEWSKETKEGIIAELRFKGKTVRDVILHPLRISDYGRATLLSGKEKEEILTIFQSASDQLTVTSLEN